MGRVRHLVESKFRDLVSTQVWTVYNLLGALLPSHIDFCRCCSGFFLPFREIHRAVFRSLAAPTGVGFVAYALTKTPTSKCLLIGVVPIR